MAMGDIRSLLRVKKSSNGQSKPPYPQGNSNLPAVIPKQFTDPDKTWMNGMSIGDGPYSAIGAGIGIGVSPPNSMGIVGTPDMWAMINKEEMMRNMLAQAQQVDMSAAQQSVFTPPRPPNQSANPPALAARAREMFLKRMGGIRSEMKIAPEDFLQCHIYGEVVHVFYCFSGRPGVTQESIDLFPSDQLITQFRLVLT